MHTTAKCAVHWAQIIFLISQANLNHSPVTSKKFMKTLSGKRLYAAAVPAIFITVIFTGRLMQVNGETLPYRELLMISAIIALTVFLLLEKNKHRKNYLAFVSGAGRQMPQLHSSDSVLASTKAK